MEFNAHSLLSRVRTHSRLSREIDGLAQKWTQEDVDRTAQRWTPRKLHATFVKHGCAIVRQAIEHSILNRTFDAVRAAYAKTDDIHVHSDAIKNESDGVLSGYELVDTPLLQRFLSIVYAGQSWHRYRVSARRISGVDENTSWQKPLDLHLDAEFHAFNFTTNFWIPFHECGIDCPSMQLVPVDYLTTRVYSGFTGEPLIQGEQWNKGHFNREAFKIDRVSARFGSRCFLRPVLRPGDLIISSNWILHGSYRTPAMRKGRSSVEVRFIGDKLDPSPRPPSILERLGCALGLGSQRDVKRKPRVRRRGLDQPFKAALYGSFSHR